jgi:type IV pilus assembly protein PilO
MRIGLREAFLLAVLLALPLASWWLVFRPQNSEIAQARREIEHKRAMLAKVQETTTRTTDLAKENEDIRGRIQAIEATLPTDKEVDTIVRQVSELAVAAGLDAPGIKSEKPIPAAMYMEQPLKMKMNGEFTGFHEFLIKLEDLPRKTRISDMKAT